MKIEVNYQGKTYTLDTEEKVTVIQTGISRRAIARTFYYLFKATYSLPRLYGRLDPKDPLGSWKTKMQEVFSKLLSEELETRGLTLISLSRYQQIR